VAKAYVRALDGGEVLFRIERTEELELRPADRACLTFLRAWSKTAGAEPMGRLKEVLGLGNPPVSPGAQPLMNEYVGAATVREVSRVTTTRGVSLTSDGLRRMVEAMEAEKAGKPAPTTPQAAAPAPRPMTATSMPTARARPAPAPAAPAAPAPAAPAGPRTALSRRPT
jgi:septal ring-binding cell division protein DamX